MAIFIFIKPSSFALKQFLLQYKTRQFKFQNDIEIEGGKGQVSI
jgi:hypothetical protein